MGQVRATVAIRDSLRMLDRAIDAVGAASVSRSLRDGAEVYQEGMRARAPHKDGTLANSIQISQVSNTEYEVGTDLVYAQIQEFGGTIRPKGHPFLKFTIGKRVVFKRSVRLRAQPYFVPTFQEDSDRAFGAFADSIDRAL
jgi:phage gpG-like protein